MWTGGYKSSVCEWFGLENGSVAGISMALLPQTWSEHRWMKKADPGPTVMTGCRETRDRNQPRQPSNHRKPSCSQTGRDLPHSLLQAPASPVTCLRKEPKNQTPYCHSCTVTYLPLSLLLQERTDTLTQRALPGHPAHSDIKILQIIMMLTFTGKLG